MFLTSQMHEGRYLQLMSAQDLYIQNITVLEHDNHSDSFQVKFRNVYKNYPLRAVRVEEKTLIDWDHHKFTLGLMSIRLNFSQHLRCSDLILLQFSWTDLIK